MPAKMDISSSGRISGLTDAARTMFLAGVFIGTPAPRAPGPARLGVTQMHALADVHPLLNQTFFIGSGKGRYHIPAGARWLVVGFVDGNAFNGSPGTYNDDVGTLKATGRIVR